MAKIPFTFEEMNQHIKDGWITSRKHPDGDLYILNYTHKTQHEWMWDDITKICRGLIIEGGIVWQILHLNLQIKGL